MKKIVECHIKDDGSRLAKVAIHNIMEGNHEGLKQFNGKTLHIVDYAIFHQDRIDKKSGEQIDEDVLVLCLKDGKSIATTSKTALKTINNFMSILGEEFPLKEPVIAEVITGSCENGTWYGLEIKG